MAVPNAVRKVRVGVIGTGFGALVQIPGFIAHPRAQVVAVSAVRPGRAEETARRLDIPRAHERWQDLVADPEVELVSIVTAPHLHHPMTMAALSHGKHVLCEKPMAMNVAEARETAEAADRAGVVHAIDHEFRYQPARLRLKWLLDNGRLGEIWHVSLTWSIGNLRQFRARPFGWLWQQETGGGMLGALGSHAIDAIHWWFGPIADVQGLLRTRVPERQDADGRTQRVTADDSFAFLARLAGGPDRPSSATRFDGADVLVRFVYAGHGFGMRLEVFGSEGTAVLEDDRRLSYAPLGEPLAAEELPERVDLPGVLLPGKPDPRTYPFLVMVDHLAAAILDGEKRDFATFHDGARIQAVLDAVRESSRTGARVVTGLA